MIAVIDYGVGNLFSLLNSLESIGAKATITSDAEIISTADKIILPGVGAFGDAMDKLVKTGLVPTLKEQAKNGKDFLGICVGMQLLFDRGFEFGEHEGLGLIRGEIHPMDKDLKLIGKEDLKIPQIGWNSLHIKMPDCPILKSTQESEYFYFVHSYYAKNCEDVLAAEAEYGVKVPGIVWQGNIYGCQFHPEISGESGQKILRSFAFYG